MASEVERELSLWGLEVKAGFRFGRFRSSSNLESSPNRSSFQHSFLRRCKERKVGMIVRSIIRCSATRRLPVCRPRILQVKPRRYSTSTSSIPVPNGSSTASMLGVFTNELDRIAPKFEIHGSQIQILRTPSEFYETFKVRYRRRCGWMCADRSSPRS
jgi:hypothetical protein